MTSRGNNKPNGNGNGQALALMERSLNVRQRLFVEYYLGEANGSATKAAELAGYGNTVASREFRGAMLLRDPRVARLVSERVAREAMTANEVLHRLREQADATLEDFVDTWDGGYRVNLEKARKAGKLHLLRSLKETKFGVELLLVDTQAAVVHLGRYHKLFTDSIEIGAKKSLLDVIRAASELGPVEVDADVDALDAEEVVEVLQLEASNAE